MPNCFITQALNRKQERPDIYGKKVVKPKGSKTGYPQYVVDMVLDLNEIPESSIRKISAFIGISTKAVFNALDNSEPRDNYTVDNWTSKNNEAYAAAELAALREHHPGGYEDHPDAAHEYNPGTALFSAPQPRDPHRRADQSHTVKRPITLPTFPFLPLPQRYAEAA